MSEMEEMFVRLKLANGRQVWAELCRKAEEEEWTYEQLLRTLLLEEMAHRQRTRLERACRAAGFPFLKTVEEFDFTFQSKLRLSMFGSYLSADFVTEGRNLVLTGQHGRGKTHLAVAVAYRALQNGFTARCATAAQLIEELSVASRAGQMKAKLGAWVQPDVVVVDELGYLTYGDDAANVLYHVVNERYLKRRTMVFTTNKTLKEWGQVLHDNDLGDAIVDRVLERGAVLRLDGPSIRSRHVRREDLGEDEGSVEPDREASPAAKATASPTSPATPQAAPAPSDAAQEATKRGKAKKAKKVGTG